MQPSANRQTFPTIVQAFLHRVKTQPDFEVFHYKSGAQWKALTWKQYHDRVKAISVGLMELGVKAEESVCVISNTRLEWVLADMAILGTLGVTVPIYASSTAEDSAYIINHCEARFLFVEDSKQVSKIFSMRNQLPKLQKIIVMDSASELKGFNSGLVMTLEQLESSGSQAVLKNSSYDRKFDNNLMFLKPSDIFTICYTSGTTGVPKGVVLVHDNVASVVQDIDKTLGANWGEEDTVLSFLPVSHIFGKVESFAAYHFGWKVYFAESIEKVFLNIGEVRPTILFAVPRIFEKVYNRIKSSIDDGSPLKKKLFNWAYGCGEAYFQKIWAGEVPTIKEFMKYQLATALVFKKIYAKFGGRLRYCVAGGAPLPQTIGEFMRIIGISIFEGYGLTETCAPVTVNTPEALKFGSIGKPLPEVTIKIADDGEILIKSRKVFKEYFKNPDATGEVKDNEHWFHTGDIGLIDTEGFVKITDRKKDLIVTSGGKNIAPQKIENLAKTHKYISQFMVYGDRRNYLTALIVLEKEETIKYAKENNILFSEYLELIKHPKTQALAQGIIDAVNKNLAPYETIKRFTVLPNEFTVETGELTPSLKIKRRFCNEKFKQELDSMYGGMSAFA